MDGAQSLTELISRLSGPREYLYPVFLALAAALAYALVRFALRPFVHGAIRRARRQWGEAFAARRVFGLLPLVVAALVLEAGVGLYPAIAGIVEQVLSALVAACLTLTLARLLNGAHEIYETLPLAARRPVKGYVQLAKIVVYILGGVVAVFALIGQSPWGILGGLGAMTAVLVLVFRDTILAFTASLQIMGNDMVRRGDWIEVPGQGADGEVVELALYTVKVRNWDNTIVNVPTYKLIEGAFKNWRGMEEAGGRRIKRSLFLDTSSVRFCDEAMLERFRRIELLKPYLAEKERELAAANAAQGADGPAINRRTLTNLGTFRAYVAAYLRRHPKLRQDMTLIVRQLEVTPNGLPLEVYCFSADTNWANYEAIQADIFDHLFAAIPSFGLRIFQNPAGADFRALAGPRGGPAAEAERAGGDAGA